MTLSAYLKFHGPRYPDGWYTFHNVRSSGHLLDTLRRVYALDVRVIQIRTQA